MTGDFKYRNLDDNTIEITDYTGSETNLIIPSTIDGKKVYSDYSYKKKAVIK